MVENAYWNDDVDADVYVVGMIFYDDPRLCLCLNHDVAVSDGVKLKEDIHKASALALASSLAWALPFAWA